MVKGCSAFVYGKVIPNQHVSCVGILKKEFRPALFLLCEIVDICQWLKGPKRLPGIYCHF